jgi:hypothetical protein
MILKYGFSIAVFGVFVCSTPRKLRIKTIKDQFWRVENLEKRT